MTGGRVVVVTGASRGIGRSCAEWFIEQGDRVAALSASGSDVPGASLSLACDVSDASAVGAAFDAVEAALGGCEVLVANAGITIDQLAVRLKDDDWQRVIDVNLTGSFLCARRSLSKMIRHDPAASSSSPRSVRSSACPDRRTMRPPRRASWGLRGRSPARSAPGGSP